MDELLIPADVEQAIIDELTRPAYSEWVESRRNTAINPRMANGGDTMGVASRWSWANAFVTDITDHPLGITTARSVRATIDADNVVTRGVDRGGNSDAATPSTTGGWLAVPVTAGVPTSFGVWLKSNLSQHSTYDIQLRTRYHDGAGAWVTPATFPAGFPNLQSGTWNWLQFADTPPPGASFLSYRLSFSPNINQRIGDEMLLTGFLDSASGSYFDGDSIATTLEHTLWQGAPDAAPSSVMSRTQLPQAFPIGTSIPETKPDLFFRVVAAGGSERDLVTDARIVSLEAFAKRETVAADAIELALAKLQLAVRQGRLGNETAYGLAVAALPQNYPLPSVPTHKRYILTIAPALRRRAVTI